MSVPLAGDHGPTCRAAPQFAAPYQTNRRSAFIIISIALLIVVAGFAFSGVLFVRYAGKFTRMDRSHESLSQEGAPGDVLHTVYTNPAYGVTLTLPGAWVPSKHPTPYLCHLVAFTRFNAVLEADFPVLTPSVDSDASLVAKRYEMNQGWTLKGEESTSVSGFPAHVLHLTTSRGADVDLMMVKKWPIIYALSVAGPSADSEHWKMVRDALAQSISLK